MLRASVCEARAAASGIRVEVFGGGLRLRHGSDRVVPLASFGTEYEHERQGIDLQQRKPRW